MGAGQCNSGRACCGPAGSLCLGPSSRRRVHLESRSLRSRPLALSGHIRPILDGRRRVKLESRSLRARPLALSGPATSATRFDPARSVRAQPFIRDAGDECNSSRARCGPAPSLCLGPSVHAAGDGCNSSRARCRARPLALSGPIRSCGRRRVQLESRSLRARPLALPLALSGPIRSQPRSCAAAPPSTTRDHSNRVCTQLLRRQQPGITATAFVRSCPAVNNQGSPSNHVRAQLLRRRRRCISQQPLRSACARDTSSRPLVHGDPRDPSLYAAEQLRRNAVAARSLVVRGGAAA